MIRLPGGLAAAFAGLALAAPAAWGALAEQPVDAPPASSISSTGSVLVQWAPDADRGDRLAARADADVGFERALSHPGLQLLEVEPGQTVGDALATLRADGAVLEAQPNRKNFPQAVPNDPLLGQLWGLRNLGGSIGIDGFPGPLAGADIDAIQAWDRTIGSPSVVVAVIDSGYRFNHPDLTAVAWTNDDPAGGGDNDGNGYVDDTRGYDFVGQNSDSPAIDNDPTDSDMLTGGHGVHVAGTVGAAGNDGAGITGIGQNLRIMPLRVCANDGSVSNPVRSSCPEDGIIDAIDYAGNNGADVANLSLGRGGDPNPLVADAFARHPGTLYVVSAGNDGADNDGGDDYYPCNYNPATDSSVAGRIDNVVCVAATDQADRLADFSSYGAASVDLAAPGTEVYSSYPRRDRYLETFSADDFGSKWTSTGASGGLARSAESPLASFGMTDTPGASPTPSTVRQSTSTGVSIPVGVGSCVFSQRRSLSVGSGNQYSYDILLNDSPVFQSGGVTASGLISTVPITALNPGGTVKIRQTYSVGATPGPANGVWLDDFKLRCFEPIASTFGTYDFLDGTSMAAPHVAGAAGLLFSLKPTATVSEVRQALLAGIEPNRATLCDPVTSLSHRRTVTGGRLNVDRSMDVLMGDGLAAIAPVSCSQPPSPLGPATPPPQQPPSTGAKCHVPKLAKLSLSRAKALLGVSNCKLGKVTKPKKRKGQKKLPPLVVRSSKPKAGTEAAAGAKIAVTLGPKPKPKKRKKR